MQTSTAFWFVVYYQYAVALVVILALILAVFTQVSDRLEKQSPRLFVGMMALLLVFLMAGAVADIVQATTTGKWGVMTVVRPVVYLCFCVRLAERAKAALRRKRSEADPGPA